MSGSEEKIQIEEKEEKTEETKKAKEEETVIIECKCEIEDTLIVTAEGATFEEATDTALQKCPDKSDTINQLADCKPITLKTYWNIHRKKN